MQDEATLDTHSECPHYHFDRHTPQYREQFQAITEQMQSRCPLAWTDTYGGHWVAAGSDQVFELARGALLSNDNDINGERKGYKGIQIPLQDYSAHVRGGMLEMDDPEHRLYRGVLNPYLSPAAVQRWTPVVDEIVRACLDEKIEEGRIDFVDDLANIVPAVLTLALMGIPARELAHLQRTSARPGLHAGRLAQPAAGGRDVLRDDRRLVAQSGRGTGVTPARVSSTDS